MHHTLELGAGLALPSMTAFALDARQVTISDMEMEKGPVRDDNDDGGSEAPCINADNVDDDYLLRGMGSTQRRVWRNILLNWRTAAIEQLKHQRSQQLQSPPQQQQQQQLAEQQQREENKQLSTNRMEAKKWIRWQHVSSVK